MKHFAPLLLAASIAVADVPAPYPLAIDSRNANAPMLELYRGSPRTIRVQFSDGAGVSDLTGLTTNDLHLVWATSNRAPAFVASDVSIYNATNGQVDFTFTSGDLNYTPGRYVYEAAAGSTVVRQGVLLINGSPFATGTNSPAWTTNVNLTGYTFSNYPWLTDAPSDGTNYARRDAGWFPLTAGLGTVTNVRRGAGSAVCLVVSNGAGPEVVLHIDSTGFATGTPIYALSGEFTGDVQAASSAGGALANVSGSNVIVWGAGGGANVSISGGLTVNGGSAVATGAPVYAESDPVWSGVSNAQAQAIATAQATGVAAMARAMLGATNFVPTNAPAGTFYNLGGGVWAVGTNDTAGGGSGSETQGLASVLSLGNRVMTANVQSAYVVIGGGAKFVPASVDGGLYSSVIIGGGGVDSEGGGYTNNVISNAYDSIIIGGNGSFIGGPASSTNLGASVYQQIIGSHGASIMWTDPDELYKYNSIGGGNNHHVYDSSFATVYGGGGTFIYNSDSVGAFSSSHHFMTGCTQVITMGGVIAASNRTGVLAWADNSRNDTNALVPNRDSAAIFGGTWIQQATPSGIVDLFSNGVPQFAASGNFQEGVITAAHVRARSLLVGEGNANSGSNNVSLLGGATFGAGAYGNVVAGQGVSIGNAVIGSFVGGTNNTQNGSYAAESGRENYNSGNYAAVNGYQNRNESQLSGILSGDANTNGSSSIRSVIVGGHRNRIAASSSMATILGGTNNTVNATGGTVLAGQGGTIGSTSTWSAVYNAGPAPYTNNTPFSFHISAQGGLLVKAIGSTFEVRTNGVYGAIGTGTWSITESGLIVNGVAK